MPAAFKVALTHHSCKINWTQSVSKAVKVSFYIIIHRTVRLDRGLNLGVELEEDGAMIREQTSFVFF